jgi:tripartite-type tricarboxylate transporter receptor subunit TctC
MRHAQTYPYPDKPLRFICPYPAGGSVDVLTRQFAQKLSEAFKQPVIVENKPGAGGNIGADFVAKSAPDGYTILMGAVATHAINPSLYPKMPYDANKDFAPIMLLASTPNVLIVNSSIPAKTVGEFVMHAKANPDKLNFGSGSNGSAGHLAGELFKSMTGTKMIHVPYKGAGPALMALLANETQLMFDNLANATPQIKAGTVRALAVTTAARTPLASELPTLNESGLPGFDIATWVGVFAPAGTPKPIVDRLNAELNKALSAPDVRERLKNLASDPGGGTPESFAAYIRSEQERYAKVVKLSGAKVD